MKSLKFLLVCLISTLLFCSCNQSPGYYSSPASQTYTPAVQFGYVGNVYSAFVTDVRGDRYVMPYQQYNSLYNTGGYNAVDQYYWTHPGDAHIRPYAAVRFQVSHSHDADLASSSFNSNYRATIASNRTYAPPSNVVNSNIKAHTRQYGTPTNSAVPSGSMNLTKTAVPSASVPRPPASGPSMNLNKASTSRPPSRSFSSPSRSSSYSSSRSYGKH